MPLELTDDGLTIQTLEEIRDELKAMYRDPETGISPTLDVSDDSVMGRRIGIHAERERSLQEQMLAIYTSYGPDATGVSLTRKALVTGTVRRDATYSTVTATVTLNAGVTLPAGSLANVAGNANSVFETDVAVTNAGGSPASLPVDMTALIAGPVLAPTGTLTVIASPVSGWTAVTNAADAEVGLPDETDEELRTRRVDELNSGASTNLAAIVTDVRKVESVQAATGYENTTSTTNGDGLPAHSFEIVIFDGVTPNADDDAVAQAIWDSQPAGIGAVHATAGIAAEGSARDVLGIDHDIEFTRADVVEVFFEVDAIIDPILYPADGDDQVAAALATYVNGRAQAIGADVAVSRLFGSIYSAVPGILDITEIRLGTTPGPVGTTTLVIGSRAIAQTDTANVLVTTTDG